MILQFMTHLFMAFVFGSFPLESEHRIPRLQDHLSSPSTLRLGTNRYYHSRQHADYKEAGKICLQKFGTGYGLAVIKTEDDLKALRAFLNKNVAPKTELWIGGSYYEGGKRFVWTEIKGKNAKPLPLAPFAVKLISGYPSKYNLNHRIVLYMKDQYTPLLKPEVYNSKRTFICEYREDWDK